MTGDYTDLDMSEIEYDPHGYISIGLFVFGLILVSVTAGAALLVWIVTGVPIFLGLTILILAFGVGMLVTAFRRWH